MNPCSYTLPTPFYPDTHLFYQWFIWFKLYKSNIWPFLTTEMAIFMFYLSSVKSCSASSAQSLALFFCPLLDSDCWWSQWWTESSCPQSVSRASMGVTVIALRVLWSAISWMQFPDYIEFLLYSYLPSARLLNVQTAPLQGLVVTLLCQSASDPNPESLCLVSLCSPTICLSLS